MKYINKIASIFGATALGMLAMTSCEGGDLYEIDSPDWIAQRVDSIKNSKVPEKEDLEGMMEDVYTIGATDYSTGWWAQFSKYYVIPAGQVWNAQFNLNINPNASNTYKNFALIICSDADRGGQGYIEYGAIRYDHQPSGNSEWGDYIIRDNVESSLTFGSDTDEGVDKLGGKVTLTIDRSDANNFIVKMSNGTVVKTYTHKSALPNINEDQSNTNIRAFLVPEGSYINWLATNIEPIGGCTSKDDKQPLSMTVKGIPGKVMVGTSLEDLVANVTAVVDFETGVTKEITAKDLTFQAIPALDNLGEKTLIAVYNKTYKGEGAEKPVIATVNFTVVDKMYTTVGDMGCTTPFWGAHSTDVWVAPGETNVATFTNYTNGVSNWNNFCVVLTREDNSEYAVVRADNFGWGAGYDGYVTATTNASNDWGAWLAAMNGAKVTVYVTNVGDGTAEVKAVMLGTDGQEYVQLYTGIAVDDPNNFRYRFTVDGSCIVFDDVIGEENNSGAFWSAHSQNIEVPAGMSVTRSFINYTSGNNNWNNFVVVLCSEDTATEYGVVRADNYGWGAGYDGIATATTNAADNWGAWLAAMDEAKVTVTVTNNGDGTADVLAVMIGNDGEEYIQTYTGIQVDPSNLWFNFTIDGSHLVFE